MSEEIYSIDYKAFKLWAHSLRFESNKLLFDSYTFKIIDDHFIRIPATVILELIDE